MLILYLFSYQSICSKKHKVGEVTGRDGKLEFAPKNKFTLLENRKIQSFCAAAHSYSKANMSLSSEATKTKAF